MYGEQELKLHCIVEKFQDISLDILAKEVRYVFYRDVVLEVIDSAKYLRVWLGKEEY